ncbi:YtnP family quorum-quenching lactonase [Salimicrobium halophilum]|uniref:Glyoxylase, beta-lactamase superfamily II n=1 Tax=Salimicrobium halophilum TaxID=86666 RepID=A0A1G8VKJ4_9BACI|nr:MBL fold metallo-hydrolase [Salimicrobium halophilum]SDJ66591.1 Glyoxylase, beta-lactamase superfamily II [Salimicrobium halophilum]
MEKLNVGEARLTWLQGGNNHLDGGAMFGVVPKPLWSKKYPVNEKNQIELRTDPILLQIDGKHLLIDSGMGRGKLSEKQKRNFGVTEESQVDESLSELGLSREDIDFVLMTHLHFDHACGLTEKKEEGYHSVFTNATIITSETEWQEMKNPNMRSKNTYWKENWEPIQHQVETFSDSYEVLAGLRMFHTSGHSDGHCVLSFERDGESFIHMADLMPTNAHQNKLWALAFDDYPVTSVHQKDKWMDEGYRKEAWYTFYHDAYYRALKFDEEGNVIDEVSRKRI